MPRLALINFMIGFLVIFASAAAGAFIGLQVTELQVMQATSEPWSLILQRSAHGHFNLFGYLHILFGLTLSYSALPHQYKLMQTIGLLLGTIAIGPGLVLRSYEAATLDPTPLAVGVGVGLSAALAAIGFHIIGLAQSYLRRG